MNRTNRTPRACFCGDHAFAILTRGKVALLDTADLPLVSDNVWCFDVYAKRGEFRDGRIATIRMHTTIIDPKDGMVVDHINGDKLDNRRENLRICTRGQNTWNRKAGGGTGSKGVTMHRGRWRARIMAKGRMRSLGVFDTEEDAARAYDEAAAKLHGPFARLNMP